MIDPKTKNPDSRTKCPTRRWKQRTPNNYV